MSKVTIGIGGKKECGKDTSARLFMEQYGFYRVAFADPLKELCAEAFDMSEYDLHDPIKKETKFAHPFVVDAEYAARLAAEVRKIAPYDVEVEALKSLEADITGKAFDTPRQILQYVGTDSVRQFIRDSFWIDVFNNKIKNMDKVVITDMRFPNEREYVRNVLKGKLLLIQRGPTLAAGTHSSENSLGNSSEYDAVIENDSTVLDLHNKLGTFYKCLQDGTPYPPTKTSLLNRLLKFLKIR